MVGDEVQDHLRPRRLIVRELLGRSGIIPFLRGALGSNLSRFLAIRDQLGVDPDDMFVNPYLNRVLFA